MKIVLSLSVTLLLTMLSFAQTFQIKYTQTMDIDALNDSINSNERAKAFISDEMRDQIFSQMAKPQDYFLTYSNGKSLYVIAPLEEGKEEEEENLQVGQGRRFNFRILRNKFSPIVYKDFETNQTIKEQPIFDKKFLIKDQLQTLDWEITDQTKTFGDFTCQMATATNKKNEKVEACYTEDIPINEGPDDYYGLPGLVVEVKIGPKLIHMTEIKIIDETTELQAPSDGKEVTQEEFDTLLKEKTESMRSSKGMSIFH